MDGPATPILDDTQDKREALMTPYISGTPAQGGMNRPTSEYISATPGYIGGFSPGPNNMQSPGYFASPNPYSPNAYDQASPAYRNHQSPIYQPF
jgi:hypothetical protein